MCFFKSKLNDDIKIELNNNHNREEQEDDKTNQQDVAPTTTATAAVNTVANEMKSVKSDA